MTNSGVDPSCECKVGRQKAEYELSNLDSDLLTRRQEDGASLRELADFINKQILETELENADVDVNNALHGAVDNERAVTTIYNALNGEDVPADRAARVRTRLSQLGIDIEDVEENWVTHPTVRSHLQDCLNKDTSRSSTITPSSAQDTIEWARAKCANIVEQTFQRLRTANIISTGPLRVTATIQITCTNCGMTFRPGELLNSGECNCNNPE